MKSVIFNFCNKTPKSLISNKYLYSKMLVKVSEPVITLAKLLANGDMRTKGSYVSLSNHLSYDSLQIDGTHIDKTMFNYSERELLCIAIRVGRKRLEELKDVERVLLRQKGRQDLMIKLGM